MTYYSKSIVIRTLVIPKIFRKILIQKAHINGNGRHLDWEQTRRQLPLFTWYGIHADLKRFVANCAGCMEHQEEAQTYHQSHGQEIVDNQMAGGSCSGSRYGKVVENSTLQCNGLNFKNKCERKVAENSTLQCNGLNENTIQPDEPFINHLYALTDLLTQPSLTVKEVTNEQRSCPELSKAISCLENHIPINDTDEITRWYMKNCNLYEGVLCQSTDGILKVILPKEWRKFALENAHSSTKNGGHFKEKKTRQKLRLVSWYSIIKDIKEYIEFCPECQLRTKNFQRIPLQPTQVSAVFQKMGVDLCGPMPITARGNKYIANFVDMFSKFVISVPLSDSKASTFINALMKEVVYKYGEPTELLSDNASNFTAESLKQLCDDLRIHKVYVTPHHSTSNGATERTFRTWRQRIATLSEAKGTDWDLLLPAVQYVYNTSVHSSTEFTPFYLMFGRESKLPVEELFYPWRTINGEPNWYADNYDCYPRQLELQQLAGSWEICSDNLVKTNATMKRQFDRHAHESQVKIGDTVTMKKFTHAVGSTQKFANFWEGLYKVIYLPDSHHALIVRNGDKPESARKVHLDQIKVFHESQSTIETEPQYDINVEPTEVNDQSMNRQTNSRPYVIPQKRQEHGNDHHKPNEETINPTVTRSGRTIKPTHKFEEWHRNLAEKPWYG